MVDASNNYSFIEPVQNNYTFSDPDAQFSRVDDIVASINENVGKNGVKKSDVLKYYNMISASDFDKYLISKQQLELDNKGEEATAQAIKDKENERFYNLSLRSIGENTTRVLVNVLNDLVAYVNSDYKTFGGLFNIFTKEDRLIYVGIVVIILSLMFYFVNVSQ